MNCLNDRLKSELATYTDNPLSAENILKYAELVKKSMKEPHNIDVIIDVNTVHDEVLLIIQKVKDEQ